MCAAAEHDSGLSGVVRDQHGVPQMGAVIELIGAGRSGGRTTVTGLDGHFHFNDLLAGTYSLHASASFLRPASTRGVRVASGIQAVVNLTLGSLYDSATLLPAERRQPDEPNDDWMWTMRSVASRPVLRVAGAGTQTTRREGARQTSLPIFAIITSQSGGFGDSGLEQSVSLGLRAQDDTRQFAGAVRYGLAQRTPGASPLHGQAVMTRQTSPWSSLATLVSYDQNPEITRLTGGTAGSHFVRIASSESVSLGDTIAFQVGGLIEADQSSRRALASRPFGRVRVNIRKDWSIGYAAATDRGMQGIAETNLTGNDESHEATAPLRGVGRVERGRHDAILLGGQSTSRHLVVSYYRDVLNRTPRAWFRGCTARGTFARDARPRGRNSH